MSSANEINRLLVERQRPYSALSIIWIFPLLSGAFSVFLFWSAWSAATSAIQECAAGALACGVAIPPYILCRAIEKIRG